MNIAITVEGILRNTANDALISTGSGIYHALAAHHSIYLVSDDIDHEAVRRWLRLHGLDRHMKVIHNRHAADRRSTTQIRLDAISQLSGTGTKVNLVIEPDPAVTAELLAQGYPTATLTLPNFAKPEWRPDYTQAPRPWDDLVAEARLQADTHARDPRRTAEPL
ncbi:hypothetical protein [Streptomyces sp. UNOC14_S4]|uniref:hypothetical protein n=1 Tax=Streptomyces sp. UNOC14_S4 TaxID=2872340 RepID=UPI001E40ABE4|nr:hypothetical protein [Streptomyces sp. UNOC14_S4]MCC3765994.1 hypothetical protein [Streptomyces sp. UNOC14_S4]